VAEPPNSLPPPLTASSPVNSEAVSSAALPTPPRPTRQHSCCLKSERSPRAALRQRPTCPDHAAPRALPPCNPPCQPCCAPAVAAVRAREPAEAGATVRAREPAEAGAREAGAREALVEPAEAGATVRAREPAEAGAREALVEPAEPPLDAQP